MQGALKAPQVPLIGQLAEMEEGERIAAPDIRLTQSWRVVTIHNLSGKPMSHESTAIVTNVDLMMSESDRAKRPALLGSRG